MVSNRTATRQVTVNAAFLREIKDDNIQLKALWDKISGMISHQEMAANHWPELMSLFNELRDQLAIHFSLEEAYGYFDDAINIAPRLSLTAESLRGQHSVLFGQIRDLADKIAEVDSEVPEHRERLIRRFHQFQTAFQSHEESELKLILESLDDDIGVGD